MFYMISQVCRELRDASFDAINFEVLLEFLPGVGKERERENKFQFFEDGTGT